MNSILLCVVLAAFTNFQRLSAATIGTDIVSPRVLARTPHETEAYKNITSCGGVLTQGPAEIYQHFEHDKPPSKVECVWTIQAPADHAVYIKSLSVTVVALPDGPFPNNPSDSIDFQIYEGNTTTRSKLLYRFDKLTSPRHYVSNGPIITVVLDYDDSQLYEHHYLTLRYGFVKQSDIPDLLH